MTSGSIARSRVGGHLPERLAAGQLPDFLLSRFIELALQPGEAAGEGGERVFVAFTEGDAEQE